MQNLPSPQEIRAQLNAYILGTAGQAEPVGEVTDRAIPGPGGELGLRAYAPPGDGPFPLVVFAHGAGWVAGNLDTHDNVCRWLCSRVPAVVVSVDYRLAPEQKFPAALDDAYAATLWAAEHAEALGADPDRLAVVGDSSGANLVAAVCLQIKAKGGPGIAFQLLVNPALDLTAYDGPGFDNMRWFRDQYLNGPDDHENPYASPVLADDLSEMPPALIVVSEQDNLRAEGELYATRLRQAGGFANDYCLRGTGHLSALYARASGEAQEALDLSVVALRAALYAMERSSQ